MNKLINECDCEVCGVEYVASTTKTDICITCFIKKGLAKGISKEISYKEYHDNIK